MPLDNAPEDSWPRWYAERRLLPFLRRAALPEACAAAVHAVIDRIEDLAGPAESPARIPLHQLHPLLVHACLFGATYHSAVHEAARALL
jgi:fructosamine-3-kinase